MKHAVLLLCLLLSSAPARADHLRPGDVAPFTRDTSTSPPTLTAIGDGVIDVADVVTLLRASVNIDVLAPDAASSASDTRITQLEAKVAALEALLAGFTRSGSDVMLTGANLHVRNGLGATETANGLGNVIIGYAEPRGFLEDRRGGSHGLVLGTRNNHTSWGGLVVGDGNEIAAPFAVVLGGLSNTASGFASSVSGGEGNEASGAFASVAGGFGNEASGAHAAVAAGNANQASGSGASVAGGAGNSALGEDSAVSGGLGNDASAEFACVSGGEGRLAASPSSWAAGSLLEQQ